MIFIERAYRNKCTVVSGSVRCRAWDAVEATGKNPMEKELEFDDNPVVVILE